MDGSKHGTVHQLTLYYVTTCDRIRRHKPVVVVFNSQEAAVHILCLVYQRDMKKNVRCNIEYIKHLTVVAV